MSEVPVVAPTRRRETTRQRLLEAAAEVFGEVGVDASSVELISERAGFTRGAFYSNFETKEEMLLEVVTHLSEQEIAEVSARAEAIAASGERLDPQDLVLRVLGTDVSKPAQVLLASEIRTRALRDPRLAGMYTAWQNRMHDRVGAVVTELTQKYGMRPRLPAREFARVLLQEWEESAVDAVIAGFDLAAARTAVNERTAALAAALVDPV